MVPKSKSKEYSEPFSSHPVPPSAWGSPHPKQATTVCKQKAKNTVNRLPPTVPPSAWDSPHPKKTNTAMNICVPFQSLYTYTQANMHY